MKKIGILLLSAMLLLTGCGGGDKTQTPAASQNVVKIADLAELPAAIQDNTIIELQEGLQDISEAFGDAYDGDVEWAHAYLDYVGDGFALTIYDVTNLTIRGAGADKTELVVESAFADVLRFVDCNNVIVEKMTMGHLVEEGMCEGAVVEVSDCRDVQLNNLDLYGCGTYGVENNGSENVVVKDSVIHDCSYGIIYAYEGDMKLENCQLNNCRDYCGIEAFQSTIAITGCDFSGNTFNSGLATAVGNNKITFDKCSFGPAETYDILYGLTNSDELTFAKNCQYDETLKLSGNVVFVHNPEELFDAIAPDTSIVLMDYWYDLSSFMEETFYRDGSDWNEAHPYVDLEEVYDGVQARIHNVNNLTVAGCYSSDYAASIMVDPRYADVFCFEDCDGITLANMTVGHTDTGDCSGNVVTLLDCANVNIRNCDLYGCGVDGIYTDGIQNLFVTDSVIHDCSDVGLNLHDTVGEIVFENCDIYDNDWGISYSGKTTMTMKNCRLGEAELACVGESQRIEAMDCEPYDIWYYEDNIDYEEADINPLEGRDGVRFDSEVLKNTGWSGFLENSEGGQYYLDTPVELQFDADGNAVLEGYWENPVHVTLQYDESGYYAEGYDDEGDAAMIYLYAYPDEEESDLVLELDIGEVVLFFN